MVIVSVLLFEFTTLIYRDEYEVRNEKADKQAI